MEENILNNLPPFYVGQKVVGNPTNVNSRIKKGAIYTIRLCHYSESGNPISPKGAKYWYVGVNEFADHDWMAPYLFLPLQVHNFPLISLTKVLEKEKQLLNAN